MKAIVVRLSETSRINERATQRLQKRATVLLRDKRVAEDAGHETVVQDLKEKLEQGYREIEDGSKVTENAKDVLKWLCGELFDNMYPGTVFEREVTALELLHCSVDSMCADAPMKETFFSPDMTKTLLNLLLSSWDKSRRLAADLLFKFPRPLPSYSTAVELIPLVDRGCKLGSSGLCYVFFCHIPHITHYVSMLILILSDNSIDSGQYQGYSHIRS